MNNDFISLFQENSAYIDKRGPLNKKLILIQETRNAILDQLGNIESRVMKEIADIPSPACNHDICLHIKLQDSYMEEVYACISCENFMMVPDSLSHIIEVKTEMNEEDLKTLLHCLRAVINNKLNYEPNMSIARVVEIVEDYLGPRIDSTRK